MGLGVVSGKEGCACGGCGRKEVECLKITFDTGFELLQQDTAALARCCDVDVDHSGSCEIYFKLHSHSRERKRVAFRTRRSQLTASHSSFE